MRTFETGNKEEGPSMKNRIILLTATASLALSGCAASGGGTTGTASGQATPPQEISAAEKQEGAKAHPELLQEFGGAYSGKQAGYVTNVGQTIAVQSGLGNAKSDFTVTLLNSPVNNAFAIPGGYVYLTRNLMGLMNDEAEMAGVLGHEVGHVAARHGQQRQKAATRNSILGVLGTIAGGLLGGSGGVLGMLGGALQNYSGTVAQLLTLSYSRDQEREADDLGIRYLNTAGYDTMALSSMLSSLAAQSALEARVSGRDARSVPEWASTHPDPASRVTRAASVAQSVGGTGGVRNRDTFLTNLDGMMYGDDPEQGVIDGKTFRHPDLRLRFTIPDGFGMQNGTRAVTISGQSGQAQFSTGSYNGNLESYVGNVFQALAGQGNSINYGSVSRTTVNGLPAAYATARANTQSGQVDVTVFAYQFASDRAYHFVALAPAGRGGVFNSMYSSFARLSAAEAAAIKPRKIDVVTVQPGDTVASLSNRMAYDSMKQERYLVLNGLNANSQLRAGQRVKLVTY